PGPRQVHDRHVTFDLTSHFRIQTSLVLVYGLHDDRWNATHRARVVTRQLPAVVPAAAVRDDVARDVLDDQIAAPDAERGPLIERQPSSWRRVPPDNVVTSVHESMQSRTDRRRSRDFVVGAFEHGIFRLERRTTRPARRRPS